MDHSLGFVAGQVLTYLDQKKEAPMARLAADIRCPLQRLKSAIGILARGGLVQVSEQNQEETIISKAGGTAREMNAA
jgi:hypothetical protein